MRILSSDPHKTDQSQTKRWGQRKKPSPSSLLMPCHLPAHLNSSFHRRISGSCIHKFGCIIKKKGSAETDFLQCLNLNANTSTLFPVLNTLPQALISLCQKQDLGTIHDNTFSKYTPNILELRPSLSTGCSLHVIALPAPLPSCLSHKGVFRSYNTPWQGVSGWGMNQPLSVCSVPVIC